MQPRAPKAIASIARALGASVDDPGDAKARVSWLCAKSGVNGLSQLGVDSSLLATVADAALSRPQIRNTPPPVPTRAEIIGLVNSAM
jgi:alcohol dehydrogenase class IV